MSAHVRYDDDQDRGDDLGAARPDRAVTPVRAPPEGAHALVVGAAGISGGSARRAAVSAELALLRLVDRSRAERLLP